jgi:hypothetical protein
MASVKAAAGSSFRYATWTEAFRAFSSYGSTARKGFLKGSFGALLWAGAFI